MARVSLHLCLNQGKLLSRAERWLAGLCVCVCVCVKGWALGGMLLGLVAHEPTETVRSSFSAHMAEFCLYGEEILMIRMLQHYPITFLISLLIGKEIDKQRSNEHSGFTNEYKNQTIHSLNLTITFNSCKIRTFFTCNT
jgi:hypothetical protein